MTEMTALMIDFDDPEVERACRAMKAVAATRPVYPRATTRRYRRRLRSRYWDYGMCAYYARTLNLPGSDPEAICSFGCQDEPFCQTMYPGAPGWPSHSPTWRGRWVRRLYGSSGDTDLSTNTPRKDQ